MESAVVCILLEVKVAGLHPRPGLWISSFSSHSPGNLQIAPSLECESELCVRHVFAGSSRPVHISSVQFQRLIQPILIVSHFMLQLHYVEQSWQAEPRVQSPNFVWKPSPLASPLGATSPCPCLSGLSDSIFVPIGKTPRHTHTIPSHVVKDRGSTHMNLHKTPL